MAVTSDTYESLERALGEIFPDTEIRLSPEQSRSHSPAARVDVHAVVGQLHLEIEILTMSSNARLLDAVELHRLPGDTGDSSIPVLASPYLSPAKQQLLRDARTAFIDFAGNAWLVAPGVHIDRRGFGNPETEVREQRDIFSDKASLVLRALLGARTPIGVRHIAESVSSGDEQIQLTPGYVSKVIKELQRRSYAAKRDDGIVLRHADGLLSDWLVAYRGRKRPFSRSYFIAAPNAGSLLPDLVTAFDARHVDYVLTGHAGASIVDRYADFDVVEVYVRSLDEADNVLIGMGARRVDRGGNVHVSLPYYKVSAFYGVQMPKGPIRIASDIQLYLDLYDYPVRGREQAEHLFERRIRPVLERGDQL